MKDELFLELKEEKISKALFQKEAYFFSSMILLFLFVTNVFDRLFEDFSFLPKLIAEFLFILEGEKSAFAGEDGLVNFIDLKSIPKGSNDE